MANWLDSAIGWMAPGWGARREYHRARLNELRKYDGAKVGRRTAGWATSTAGANTEALVALPRLIGRSRDLLRNDPFARKAVTNIVTALVGTGIRPRFTDKRVGELWKAFARQSDAEQLLNLGGQQRQIARAFLESGGCLVRFRSRRPEDGLAVPLQLQVLEIDFLDVHRNENGSNGNVIIGGVEFDAIGRRIAYWLFDTHPGESGRIRQGLTSRRVPASEVIHLFDPERPGQVHGVPRLSTVMLYLADVGDLREADIVKRKMEACFVGIVTTDDPSVSMAQLSGAPKAGKLAEERLSPGMFKYIPHGTSVQFGSPAPSGGAPEMLRMSLQSIAAGSGTTYERMSGDLSQANFSSLRGGDLPFHAEIEQLQACLLIPMLMERIAERFVQTLAIAGLVNDAAPPEDWTFPRVSQIDPLKETNADIAAIRMRMKSRSEFLRERGYDPLEVFDEIADEEQQLLARGLSLEVAATAAAASDPSEDDEDSKDDDDEKDADSPAAKKKQAARALNGFH